LWLDCFGNDEVNAPLEKRLEQFLDVHVRIEGFALELDQEIKIASLAGVSSCGRAEKPQPADAEPSQLRTMRANHAQNACCTLHRSAELWSVIIAFDQLVAFGASTSRRFSRLRG